LWVKLACLLLLLLLLILKTNKVEIMYHVFFRGIYRQHLKDRIWIGSFSSCFFLLLLLLVYSSHFNLFAFTYFYVWVYFLFKMMQKFFRLYFFFVLAMLLWVLRSILISKQAIMPYTFFFNSVLYFC
jgi:hypothetical protein